MNQKEEEVSEEFKKRVEQFVQDLVNYEELTPENKALYDIIAEICKKVDESS